MSLVNIIVVKFTDAIARVLEQIKSGQEGGATFRVGVTTLFVASLPVVMSRAPTALSRGGCDCGALAASSIPQGVCSLHHGCSRPMGASSYCFSHGRRKVNQKHGKKDIIRQVKLLEVDAA